MSNFPNIIAFDAQIEKCLEKNANTANWAPWDAPPDWKEECGPWRAFADKWSQQSGGPLYDNHRLLDLSEIYYVSPFQAPSSILVRECYDKAVTGVLKMAAKSPTCGAVLTGQPGIGKSTFLLYMLVVLLRRHQPVFVDIDPVSKPLFFYRGRVYENVFRTFGSSTFPVPLTLNDSKAFIWSLFDFSKENRSRAPHTRGSFFPVQAPSPNLALYKNFEEERNPLVTVFPLWTKDELKSGLLLQSEFPSLQEELSRLVQFTAWSDCDSSFKYTHCLKILKSIYQDKPPTSVNDALDALIDFFVYSFGYVARDVFGAVSGYRSTLQEHSGASVITYEQLKTVVSNVLKQIIPDKDEPFHGLVCVSSRTEVGQHVKWRIQYKSRMVSKQLAHRWALAQDDQVLDLINHFSHIPAAHSLNGGLFESHVHRLIQSNNQGDHWELKPMSLSESTSTFSFEPDAKSVFLIPKRLRTAIIINTNIIGRQELEEGKYYIPSDKNFPVIDSFLFEFKSATSADLWLFQMTVSPIHQGSSKGYTFIRRIVNKIIALLKKQSADAQVADESGGRPAKRRKTNAVLRPSVDVHYILVSPLSEKQHQWILPPGITGIKGADGYFMPIDVQSIAHPVVFDDHDDDYASEDAEIEEDEDDGGEGDEGDEEETYGANHLNTTTAKRAPNVM